MEQSAGAFCVESPSGVLVLVGYHEYLELPLAFRVFGVVQSKHLKALPFAGVKRGA